MLVRSLILLLMAVPLWAQPALVRRFGDGHDGFSQYSGIADSQRVVIRDTTAWRKYWTDIHRPFIPAPAVPAVDFSHEVVLLASMGTRRSGGFVIRIDSATTDSASLIVQVTQVLPGRGCAVPAAVTQPVDLVRLPALSLPIAFRERVERTDCPPVSAPHRR